MYYIHSKPNGEVSNEIIPVLLLYAWPGSISAYYEFIRMLTSFNSESKYVFEVIAPILPGYSWSQVNANDSENGAAHVANLLRELMLRIGHRQFVMQSGDWGSIIGAKMITLFPEKVLAYHISLCVSITPLSTVKWMTSDFWSLFVGTSYHVPTKRFMNPVNSEHYQEYPDAAGSIKNNISNFNSKTISVIHFFSH